MIDENKNTPQVPKATNGEPPELIELPKDAIDEVKQEPPPPGEGDNTQKPWEETNGKPQPSAEETSAQNGTQDKNEDEHPRIGTLNLSDQINQVIIGDGNYGELKAPLVFEKAKHCSPPIPLEDDQELKIYEFDESFISSALKILLGKRILVLAGALNTGKTTTALRICQKMDEIPPKYVNEQVVRRIRPLKAALRIDLLKIVKDKEFSHTTLIFEQAFANGNTELKEFFANFDERELPGLFDELEEQNSYLIFTTNSEMIQAYKPGLNRAGILCTQPNLPKEQLEIWFSKRLRSYAEIRGRKSEELDTLLATEKDEIDKLFETWQIPRLNEFINEYLERVLDGDITVKNAFEGLEGSDKWFLEELTGSTEKPSKETAFLDFELWCFVLTLTLTQCVRETTDATLSEAVPWEFFEQFRKKITNTLRDIFIIPDPKRITLKNYVSEQRWLSQGRAEIYQDVDYHADMIRFKNPRQAEQIWEVLLKKARRVLLMLRPALEKLAMEHDPGIRSMAAKILGRIGEIDIEEITFNLINKWIRSDNSQRMATVGYVYEGILSSQNAVYRDQCWKSLEGMHERGSGGLWTAIATYKQIGKYMLPETMRQLREIAEFALTEQTRLEKHVAKLPSQVSLELEETIKENLPELAGADLRSFRTLIEKDMWKDLRKKLLAVYEEDPYFMAFKYTLIVLCLNVGSFKVFGELHSWFKSDNEELKMLVALNFLREEGIAETLGKFSVETPSSAASGEKPILMNLIVDDMTQSDDAVEKMATFLEDVYCGFEVSGPSLVKSYYRQQFLQILKCWAKESLQNEKHREVVTKLFALFLNSYISDLKNSVDDFIRGDAEFSDEENPLYSFRQKVFERSIAN